MHHIRFGKAGQACVSRREATMNETNDAKVIWSLHRIWTTTFKITLATTSYNELEIGCATRFG